MDADDDRVRAQGGVNRRRHGGRHGSAHPATLIRARPAATAGSDRSERAAFRPAGGSTGVGRPAVGRSVPHECSLSVTHTRLQ